MTGLRKRGGRRPSTPSDPIRGFVWAIVWLMLSVPAGLLLALEWDRVLGGEINSLKAGGFILCMPFLSLGFAAIAGVGAVRALRPWRAYRARTSPEERRRNDARRGKELPAPLVIVVGAAVGGASIIAAVVAAVAWSNRAITDSGALLVVIGLFLVGMIWVPMLDIGVRRHRAGRPSATEEAVA